MTKIYALVDCNSFFASCERLFRPDLAKTPIVVLSNNDGCVIARTAEAKALGIKMGAPYFKVKKELGQHGVEVFSSNFALYGDISNRVMETLEQLAPALEVYSIDEAFLDLERLSCVTSLDSYGRHIQSTVLRHIGMPVGVGIGSTKTLAKLANHIAKTKPLTGGVVDLSDTAWRQKALAITPVEEVWGVGRKISTQLHGMGINTAADLARADRNVIRQRFSVVLERTQRELNGTNCLDLETIAPTKQQIICSRSFGQRITQYEPMREALSTYAARATEKLRAERQQCRVVTAYIRTSPFNDSKPYYANSRTIQLSHPTTDSRVIAKASREILNSIWQDGYEFMKAGIMLNDFSPAGKGQLHLFDSPNEIKATKLMSVMDRINQQGKGKVQLASEGINKPWGMNRQKLSPSYTTNWNELPIVQA